MKENIFSNPLVIYICINMSNSARAEHKVKIHFLSLLRRSRCSRRSLKDHRQLPFSFVDVAKIDTKKTSQIVWNVLGKIWECLGRIWERTNRFSLLFVTFYLILEPLHNNHRTVSSHHPEVGNYSICPHPPSQISDS